MLERDMRAIERDVQYNTMKSLLDTIDSVETNEVVRSPKCVCQPQSRRGCGQLECAKTPSVLQELEKYRDVYDKARAALLRRIGPRKDWLFERFNFI